MLVLRPNIRGMPETMVCRILMFTWFGGPYFSLSFIEAQRTKLRFLPMMISGIRFFVGS